MTKNKLRIFLLISSFAFLIIGLCHFCIVNQFDFKDFGIQVIVSLIPSVVVFGILKIVDVLLGLIGSKYRIYKTYFLAWVITLAVMFIFMAGFAMEKNTIVSAFVKCGYLFSFTYFISCMILLLFLIGTKEEYKDPEVKIEYLDRRLATKKNPQNLTVSLGRFLEPEMYFDDPYGKDLFLSNEEKIQSDAENAAIKFINENQIQNICGEWFLSRVDFNCKNSFDEPLMYCMNFIDKTITDYRYYGIHVLNKKTETESCRLVVYFDYDSNDSESPFKISDICLENN